MGDVLLYLFWTNCQSLCNHLLKYTERIIVCVNSWEFYPSPKIFYTLVTKSTSAPRPIFSFLSWQGPCQGPLEDCDFENFDVLLWGMQFSGDGALLKNTKNHIECAKIPKSHVLILKIANVKSQHIANGSFLFPLLLEILACLTLPYPRQGKHQNYCWEIELRRK